MVAWASSKEIYQLLPRLSKHCKELRGIYLNLTIYRIQQSFGCDYATFTGKHVHPSQKVIQLCFQFLTFKRRGIILCSLCSDKVVLFNSMGVHWFLSVLQHYPHDAFSMPLSNCCGNLAWAARNFWSNTASGGLSSHTHNHSTPAVQSKADAAVNKKSFITYLSPEHSQMPILSCCNTGEFNSYPDNVVNQLEVLLPLGYSH